MNILVAFNDNYAMPTRVMLKSLIENNHEIINIYVLYISLMKETINIISTLNSRTSIVHFIQIDDTKLANVPIMSFYSKEAYIRLFAQIYLPEEVDRILWLDSDVIVNGEIRNFYHQSFDDKLYVAYKDPMDGDSVEKKASLGMPEDAIYINSGVLLMNLETIRKRLNDNDITNYIRDYYNKIQFVDQDVFNGLLYDSFKVIKTEDYTYNYFVNQITPWNRNKVFQNARIIHYATGRKPWKKYYKYYGLHLWWNYALTTDKNYRKQFRNIYISCILAQSKHIVALKVKRWFPRLYGILVKLEKK